MSQYHEPVEEMPERDRDITRALLSLKEEIEAVDWYNQRAAVTKDEALKAILLHNRNEEIEHACMALEYLRRIIPEFDEELRTYLFTEAPIHQLEESGEGESDGGPGEDGRSGLGIGKTDDE